MAAGALTRGGVDRDVDQFRRRVVNGYITSRVSRQGRNGHGDLLDEPGRHVSVHEQQGMYPIGAG